MKILLLALAFSLFSPAFAQYYYNDIIGTLETNGQMKTYLDNKVRMVTATGFDANGVKATDFAEVKEIKENGRALKMSSRADGNYGSYYNRFDDKGRLISITDSSTALQSVTIYEYNNEGHITLVQNTVRDSANDFGQVEKHIWFYNSNGQPQKMWRVINNSDSLEIRLFADEDGNTVDEKTYRNGIETSSVLYYYDDNKRLTDIVRFNIKFKKLLPDQMFEYDDNNRVIQKITTTSSLHLSYLIWRFIYNEQGLKTKEALFNDNKQLTGKIEYAYTFGQ